MNSSSVDIEKLNDLYQDLVQAFDIDLESGSHHFNNAAHEQFAKRYPTIIKTLRELGTYITTEYARGHA